jgi:oligoribonuclease (3'-5' exoribonuclease)
MDIFEKIRDTVDDEMWDELSSAQMNKLHKAFDKAEQRLEAGQHETIVIPPDRKDVFFIIDYETTGIGRKDVPIEVGIIVVDSEWNELDRMESLIYSDYAISLSPEYWGKAKEFHGIDQETIKYKGVFASHVAKQIHRKVKKWQPINGSVILLSDNIQFEWRHTQWLFDLIDLEITDVFHYCGWDTSLLSLFTSFQDPSGTEHRALSDVEGLLNELRRVSKEV